MDLADSVGCLTVARKLFSTEKIDILVNNGGVSQRELFENMQFDVCQRMMDVNCTSHIAITSAVLPGMIERHTGHIVNILSVSGLIANPVRTLYSASKFGLRGFG
jgi:dehydrogenase/reductase SDR family member 7B